MDVNNLSELYEEMLLISPGLVTATGISKVMDNEVSHDKITRLLSGGIFSEKYIWQKAKSLCHEIATEAAVFIIDDSIQGKPYTKENDLICWHFDHSKHRHVKGVNFLTGLYYSWGISVPVSVEFVTKPIKTRNEKGRTVRKSEVSKNELFRKMVGHAGDNLQFSYVLSDSWYGNSKNMQFIHQKNQKFIFAIKGNRKIALSREEKEKGHYVSIKTLESEGRSLVVYVKQLDFPIAITSQVFKNGDDTATLYLASNDLDLASEQMTTIYQKRWKVEEYHKSIKSNICFAKSPTKTVKTQKSHFIASIAAFNRLELLKIRKKKNHFALKSYLQIVAMKNMRIELHKLLTPNHKKVA